MLSREDADIVLDAFSKNVGIATLRLDQSGTALLAFGDAQELIFHYVAQSGQLQVWSPLHGLTLSGTTQEDSALMHYLLKKNFPSATLSGAYFAIDADIGVALLGYVIGKDVYAVDKMVADIKAFAYRVIDIVAAVEKDVAMSALSPPKVVGDDVTMIKA